MSEESNKNSSGQPRRRRSNNRNRNNQNGGNRNGGNNRNRNQGGRRAPKKPAKLEMTFLLKIKKFFGLLDEERELAKQNAKRRANRKPGSPHESPNAAKSNQKPAFKSNTRNAKSKPKSSKSGERPAVTNSRLYLGNLSFEATEYELEDLFKGIGNVKKVEIIYNRATHRSKGYGFVEMYSIDDAKRAVEVLHDQPFMGRNLVVSGAKERQENADRPPRKQQRNKEEGQDAKTQNQQPAEAEEVSFTNADSDK